MVNWFIWSFNLENSLEQTQWLRGFNLDELILLQKFAILNADGTGLWYSHFSRLSTKLTLQPAQKKMGSQGSYMDNKYIKHCGNKL